MDQPSERIIRCSDDLVEAFRARKTQLGISNETVDEQLLIGDRRQPTKYLGPSQEPRSWRQTCSVIL